MVMTAVLTAAAACSIAVVTLWNATNPPIVPSIRPSKNLMDITSVKRIFQACQERVLIPPKAGFDRRSAL